MTSNASIKSAEFFTDKLHLFQEMYSGLDRKYRQLSLIRLLLFIVTIVLFVYYANLREMYYVGGTMAVSIVLFGILIQHHNRIRFQRQHHSYLIQISKEEIQRTQGNLSGLYDGIEYLRKDHPYALDLDLFGSNSLFQLLNRSRLTKSRSILASWMLNPASQDSILKRQEAITELSSMTSWRQDLTAYGMLSDNDIDQSDALEKWLQTDQNNINVTWWTVLSVALPLISLIALAVVFMTNITYHLIFFPVIANSIVIGLIFSPLQTITTGFVNASKSFRAYGLLFGCVEKSQFDSSLLQRLNRVLVYQHSASRAITSLGKILHQLQNRANLLYMPFNMLFALDVYWFIQANKWKSKFGHLVPGWFESMHQIDALSDISTYYFINQNYCFPIINQEKYTLKVQKMGHPLIKPQERISNDFELIGHGTIGLITGSNMSGKSTFLRTVGVNLVLAQMGAPVCAFDMNLSLTRVFTSMRTQDNLEEHISSFYAELKRIKQLLDDIDEQSPIFFLLDEILKGTNSEDRHNGSKALLDQLNTSHATGLVSTHDLALSRLASQNENIINYSFNSKIIQDQIIFDYLLTPGPCKSFNASKLMENMGIIIKKH